MRDDEYQSLLNRLKISNDVELMQFVLQYGQSLGYSESELVSLMGEIYHMRKYHTPEDYMDLSGSKRDSINFSSGSLTPMEMINGKSMTSRQTYDLKSFLKRLVDRKRKY